MRCFGTTGRNDDVQEELKYSPSEHFCRTMPAVVVTIGYRKLDRLLLLLAELRQR